MISRILLGLGWTRSTSAAIRYAVELAEFHRAEVVGTTVIDRRCQCMSIGTSGNALDALRDLKHLDAKEKRQEKAVVEFVSACNAARLRYTVARERSEAYRIVTSEARYGDLVVLGLPHLSEHDMVEPGLANVLTRLISRGVHPVLGVSQKFRPMRRALLVYDGTITSANAVKRFMQMQPWPDLTVKVVTFEQTADIADGLLTDIADYCRAARCNAEVEHLPGSGRRLLLTEATKWKAELIVIGNSTKRLWMKRILGDTAMHAIKNANIPLFLSQ